MEPTFKWNTGVFIRRMGLLLALSLLAMSGIAQAKAKITMPLVTGYFNDYKVFTSYIKL